MKFIYPMLANTNKKITLDDPDYSASVKIDGVRAMIYIDEDGEIEIKTRANKDLTEKVPHLYKLGEPNLTMFPADSILEGELYMGDGTKDSFYFGDKSVAGVLNAKPPKAVALQEQYGELKLFMFEVIKFAGEWLTETPLTERNKLLTDFMLENELLDGETFMVEELITDTDAKIYLQQEIKRLGFEGMMIKKLDNGYKFTEDKCRRPAGHWYKLKDRPTVDLIVEEWAYGEGRCSNIMGMIKITDGKNREGWVGTGFTDQMRREFMEYEYPFIAEFTVFKITDKSFIQPAFIRLRPDKTIDDVSLE